MKKKKKIAFLTLTLSGGGAERVVSNLLMNLSDEKYEKYLILFDGDKVTYPYEGEIIDLKLFKKNSGILKFLNIFFAFFKLIKIKKKKNFDFVISFLDIPNLLNILSKQKEKVYVSVRTHISDSYKGKKKIIYGNIIRYFYNFSDKVIAVSNECKEDLEMCFKIERSKLVTIHNFYDLKKIQRLSSVFIEKEHTKIFEKKVIINSGRLVYQKGQEYLIKSLAHLKNKEDYNLVILGDGPLKEDLMNLSKKLGVDRQVFFLGFQDNPFKYLRNSYLYVFPSFHEGFPNALAEAMACTLPVISNDCKSGPKELLGDGEYGILIKDYNNKKMLPLYLKESIESLEKIKIYKSYSEKSKKRIHDFEIKKIIYKWEEIL